MFRTLIEPKQYKEMDFDSVESMKLAVSNIKKKKCLYDIYCESYELMVNSGKRFLEPSATKELELGSGGGFMKELYPNVITSDIMDADNADMVVDAQNLPFKDGELGVIYAMHVLHHIPDVTKFFREAERTLCVGGGIVLIEPYWGPLASFLYRNVHPEPFDKKIKEWKLPEISDGGAMSRSNQALSYLLLKRDREKFDTMFPDFEVVYDKPFNCLRYIATGGVWLKPKLPNFMFDLLKHIEKFCAPLMYLIGIHHIFVIKKRA